MLALLACMDIFADRAIEFAGPNNRHNMRSTSPDIPSRHAVGPSRHRCVPMRLRRLFDVPSTRR